MSEMGWVRNAEEQGFRESGFMLGVVQRSRGFRVTETILDATTRSEARTVKELEGLQIICKVDSADRNDLFRIGMKF